MADADNTFLALIAHKVAPFQFDVGFGAVNASIRDQIVRAQMIVRAIAQLERSPIPRPLLICGAGIAGLAAATEAKRNGLGFVLIDKLEFPSGALAGSGKRYVSPTMYEWPAPGFDDHRHPPEDAAFLGADEMTGFLLDLKTPVNMGVLRGNLEAALQTDLNTWKNNALTCTAGNWYLPKTCIAEISKNALEALMTPDPDPLAPELSLPTITLVAAGSGMTDRTIEVDWIVFAGGFSAEKTKYAGIKFATPPFWTLDDLAEDFFGLKGRGRVSALIVGSGDGAIQDALRCLVTARTPEPVAIWKAVIKNTVLNGTPTQRSLDAILREILSLDQYTNTAFMWSGQKEVFQTVDAAHAKLAEELLALSPSIQKNILSILRLDVARVHIQRNRNYFTRCYALNRFLIHLIKIVLDKNKKNHIRSREKYPILGFGSGNITPTATASGGAAQTYIWDGHTFHRVVIRIGPENKDYQTIGLSRIDAARVQFGRIPPPFVPTKA